MWVWFCESHCAVSTCYKALKPQCSPCAAIWILKYLKPRWCLKCRYHFPQWFLPCRCFIKLCISIFFHSFSRRESVNKSINSRQNEFEAMVIWIRGKLFLSIYLYFSISLIVYISLMSMRLFTISKYRKIFGLCQKVVLFINVKTRYRIPVMFMMNLISFSWRKK